MIQGTKNDKEYTWDHVHYGQFEMLTPFETGAAGSPARNRPGRPPLPLDERRRREAARRLAASKMARLEAIRIAMVAVNMTARRAAAFQAWDRRRGLMERFLVSEVSLKAGESVHKPGRTKESK